MPKKYGLIYQGSKDKLADRILRHIPSADCFVDLFAGGCSMTHVALLSGRYRRVIANDVSDIPQVFVNAANGLYDNEDRWISREDFYRLRDKDPFVRLVWSFSNNLNDYIYGRDIEPFKKALHWAVYYRDPNPLKEYSIDVSDAMAIEDRYKRWLAVKHICENRGGRRDFNQPRVQTYLQNYQAARLLVNIGIPTAACASTRISEPTTSPTWGGSYRLAALHQCGMPQLGGAERSSTLTNERMLSRKLPANAGFRIAGCK